MTGNLGVSPSPVKEVIRYWDRFRGPEGLMFLWFNAEYTRIVETLNPKLIMTFKPFQRIAQGHTGQYRFAECSVSD